MQPAISIHANGLARELLEVAWLVNRFQEGQKACIPVSLVPGSANSIPTRDTHPVLLFAANASCTNNGSFVAAIAS